MYKILLCLALAFCFCLSLVACGPTAPTENKQPEQPEVLDETPAVKSIPAILQESLAQKLGVGLEEVTVDIGQQAADHISGTVIIAPGGPTNLKTFLAAQVDQGWQIVYQGVGPPSCQVKEDYGFPEDMVSRCEPTASQTTTQESKKVSVDEEFDIVLESNATTGFKWGG